LNHIPSTRTRRRTVKGCCGPVVTIRISAPPGPMGCAVLPKTRIEAPSKVVETSTLSWLSRATSGASGCARAALAQSSSISKRRISLAPG